MSDRAPEGFEWIDEPPAAAAAPKPDFSGAPLPPPRPAELTPPQAQLPPPAPQFANAPLPPPRPPELGGHVAPPDGFEWVQDDVGQLSFGDVLGQALRKAAKATGLTSEPAAPTAADPIGDFIHEADVAAAPGVIGTAKDLAVTIKSGFDMAAMDLEGVAAKILPERVMKAISEADKFVTGKTTKEIFEQNRKAVEAAYSPKMRESLAKKWWNQDKGEFGDAFSDWRAYAGAVLQSLPESIATSGPALKLAKGAYALNIARGATPAVAAARAATVATVAGAVTEGALGGAQSEREVKEKIEKLPIATLRQSDAFKMMVAQGMSEDAARHALARDMGVRAFVTGGIATGIFGGMGDRIIAKSFLGRAAGGGWKDTAKRLGGAALGEGLAEEIPQSVLQQVAQNEAVRHADPNKSLMDDVINQGLGGAVAGGIMGAGMGGAFHRATRDTEQPAIDDFIRRKGEFDDASDAARRALPAPGQNAAAGERSGPDQSAGRPNADDGVRQQRPAGAEERPVSPAGEPGADRGPAPDAAVEAENTALRAAGWADEDIGLLSPKERAAELRDIGYAAEEVRPADHPEPAPIYAPISEVPDAVFSHFPDMQTTEQGVISVNSFTLEERAAMDRAGLIKTYKTKEGESYEGVDPEPLWREREVRAKGDREKPRPVIAQEQRDAAIERRASLYDRAAQEQEALGELGDTEKVAEYRAKAAEIRATADLQNWLAKGRRTKPMAPPAEADAPVPHETGLAPAAAAAPVAAEPKKPARRPGGGKPVTLIGWLRSNGGVKDDGGELRSRDLGKRFIGLVNSRGMSLDDARLRAAEAGYFGPMKDRQMAETTVSDLLDLIDQHPTYSSDDQEALDRIADKDAQKRAERRHEKDLARARLEIRGELGRHDLHPDEEAIDLAARLMVEDGQAWDEAFERATMRLAHETPETKAALDATATEDGYDAIPWDDYLESPPAQEAAAGATGGRDQAAGGSRQEGDRGGEEGADQRRPQEPARAGEDAQDQAPRDEGKRSEPDQDAEVEPTDAEKPEPKITVEDAVRITKARAKGDALLGQHIGEYTAVGTRESPWGTERGFGETALEAQHDARRRLGMKDWKAIGAEAFKKGENRIPPRGLAGYPYESTLWTRGWDQANIAEPVPGVDMPGRPAADPDDDLQSRIAAAERLQIADLVKRGTTGHVSPFLLADGSIIAPNIEHREFASENDRATTGMIRFNFYKENIEGRPILNIDLVSGQKFTDRQRKAFERMASANLGAQVGIDVTALNGDHIADATGIARDGFISAADSLGIIGDAAKETEPQAGSLIEREKWNDGRWKAIAGDEDAPRSANNEFFTIPQPERFDRSGPEPATTATDEPQRSAVEALRDRFLDRNAEQFPTIVQARKFMLENGFKPVEGLPENKQIEEAIEHALVLAAREIVQHTKLRPSEIFGKLVVLYEGQPRLNTRTSKSVAEQAYSTPAPLAYVASRLAGIDKTKTVLEPAAGNGMLLIEADPNRTIANEIDWTRRESLFAQGFGPTDRDAAAGPFEPGYVKGVPKPFDVVIANPPFGAVREGGESKTFRVGEFATTNIDFAIALNALQAMKPDGRAVLIVGGVKAESQAERAKGYQAASKRKFYYRLMRDYNVVDIFTVAGDLYARQGAGWPVDVIVIDGKGQSARAPLTAEPPPLLTTWGEVKEKLNGQSSPRPDGETPGASGLRGEEAGVSDPAGAGGAKAPASGGGGGPAAGRKPAPARAPERPTGSVGAEPDRGQPAPVRRVDVGAGTQPAPGPVRDGARADFVPDPDRGRPVAANAAGQAPYRPASTKAKGLGTLIPANLAAPVADSLDAVQRQHGQIDHYVADALGYDIDTEGPYFIGDDGKKARPFSAEQIDALGLALDNVEKGAGFIVGDQTGIGKGRVVAGAIRHAHKRGMLPVFVTEKPDLYGDMWRDLHDIGWDKGLGRPIEMFMTNAGVRVPLDERAVQWVAEAQAAIDAGDKPPPREGAFSTSQTTDSAARMMHEIRAGTRTPDVVFTTYDQMNSVAGQETDRREFLRAIAPRAFLIMDEAHNAGGQGEEGRGKKDAAPPRSKVFREAVGKAKAVLYSSATYAKSPKVMDLFARTDMAKAVDDPAKLGELIATGGVPMQQIVAAMLSRAGQYVRRERSFEGVSYEVETLPVDAAAYEAFTDGLGAIFQHDRLFSDERRQIADKIAAQHGAGVGTDGGTGDRAASTTEFSSIMHNAISQMVLSIKAKGAAERAIQALRDGERPVIALSATMESFLRDFTESAGVKDGDPINLDFGDVLRRYLERTRRVTIKMPDDTKRHFVIPLADMSPLARQSYEQAKAMLDAIDMSELPISPIDAIRHEIQKAGYSVREVTGRSSMIDYSGAEPRYVLRPAAEQGSAGKRVTIRMLNNGDVDAVILNRSGSTGVSMHAGERFKNQQKRRMILVQADPNIDVHLQMLGRVHRTGQVALPAYSQLAADIPAEVRPTAVLMKKMASLNANTTAARKSAFTGEAVDFMNKYGDLVATRAMLDDPETNARLGFPVSLEADGEDGIRGAMAKVTGRLTLLRPADQQALIDTLTDNYVALIERLDAEGINDLEAKAFDLQAKVLDSTIINPARGPSPFEAEVRLEQVSVKATGRSMTPDEVLGAVLDRLDMPRPADASFAKSLPVVQREARARQATLVSAITAEAKAYADKEVAALKQPEAKARARKKHDDNIARWQAIANLAAPGQIISIRFQGADMPAVVLDFASKTKPGKNPVALSAWHLAVAVPDSARTIGAPLSQIFTPQFQAKSDKEGLTISPASYTYTPATLAGAFEQARKEGRDVRWMFAGNILAAYDQTNGGGQIITHTMEDGSSRAAILMPKAFKRNDFMANRPIRFAKAQQVMQFLDRLPDGEVATTDEVVMIRKSRGSYEFDLPAARASGGRYYADAVVRAVFDGWIKKGSRMRADLSAPKAVDMIGAMMKVGAVFETRDHQDIAQAIVDGKAARPQMAQTAPEGWTHVEGIPDRHGAELARMVNQVADIFDTVLPREVGYEITREIRLHADNARDAIERSGGDHRAPNITGLYSSGMKMVRVATFAPDAANTAYHEAWHAAQDLGLATARELAVLRSPAELKRMRAFVASSKGERTAANMPPVEIEAYTFGAYASALNKGREPPRLHSVTNGVFARLYELLRRLRNFFAGRGFQTVEDIIGRFQRGDMAKRPAAERTGSRLHGEEIMTARERAEAASGRYFAETAGGPEEGADRRYFGDRSLRQKVEHRISKLPDRLDIKEGILDMHARVQATQQEIAGGGNIPSQHDVYKAKRRLPGQLAAAQQDFRKDLLEPLFDTAKKAKLSRQDIAEWLYAKHAPERNAAMDQIDPRNEGRGSGITDDEAQAIVDRLTREGKAGALENVARHVADIRDFILERSVETGLMSQKNADELSTRYEAYVPLQGWDDPTQAPENARELRPGGGLRVKGPEHRQAFGRKTIPADPLSTLINNAMRTIDRAEKNKALRVAWRFLRTIPADELSGVRLDKGRLEKAINPETGLVYYKEEAAWRHRDNVVPLKIGGVPHYIVFDDPVIAKAWMRMSAEQLHWTLAWAGRVVNVAKSAWTHWNPEFVARHFGMRYPIEGALNAAEHGGKAALGSFKSYPMGPAYRAIRAYHGLDAAARADLARRAQDPNATQHDKYLAAFHEMREQGGLMSWADFGGVDRIRAKIDRALLTLDKNPVKASIGYMRAAHEAIDLVTSAMDNAQRLVAYMQARERGLNKIDAALEAREATVDFAVKGVWANYLTLMWPFANTAAQTASRMARAARRNPRQMLGKVIGGMFSFGMAAALYAYLFGGNDEDGTPFIEKTGDWTRRLHVVVPIPGAKDEKKRPYMLQISLPYNYAMPFVAGQTVIALMMRAEGRSKQDVGKILGNLTHSVLEGTTPLAQEHSLVGKMTPELMRPFLHVAMNQNWHGAPVHPSDEPWNKGIPASEKGFRSTAEMWKRLARVAHQTTGLDYHPEDYREVMSYFTSTLQGVASRAGDAASDVRSGRKPDPTDVPVAHAFIGGGKQYDSADRRAYYEARDKAFAAETRFKDLKKAAQIDPSKAELVQDFYEKHQADIRAARLFRSGTGTLSDLTKQMNRIQQNKDMTPTEQETELRALRERQLSTMNRLRERVRAGGE